MAAMGFNVADVDPDQGGGALPAGVHQLHVIEESLKPSSTGKGEVLSLTYEVYEGEGQGRKMWVSINMTHTNPVAQNIGQRQIKSLCMAIGGDDFNPGDTEELLWKPFWAETVVDEDEYKGKKRERANVKKYLFGDDLQPPAEKPQAQQQAPVQRQAAPQRPQRPASAPQRPAAGGGAPRSLPWQNRSGGGAPQGGGNGIPQDDDIPF